MSNFEQLHNLRQNNSTIYYSFYDVTGSLINNVIHVNILKDGQFGDLTCEDEEGVVTHYTNVEYTYTQEALYVLGIGYLLPGDIVKLKRSDKVSFTVGFGWHINISNQNIYSWYLTPNDSDLPNIYSPDGKVLTLYKDYLNTIEVVSYTKPRTSFNIGGTSNGCIIP